MYVIQERFHEWDKWDTLTWIGRFKTIDEAKEAMKKRPVPSVCRIAEEYTVVRYKAVKV